MTAALAKYDEARRALAEAYRVDEVKDIADKAAAMQHYARQAKDGELIAYATEIRKRAERRLGQIMAEEREAGRLAKPPNPKRRVAKKPDDPPTLAEQGIGKALADRARKAAALPEDEFEAKVAQTVKIAVAATEGDREIIKAARAEQQAKKRARRVEREIELDRGDGGGADGFAHDTVVHGAAPATPTEPPPDPAAIAAAAVNQLKPAELQSFLDQLSPGHKRAFEQKFGARNSDNTNVEIATLAGECTALLAHPAQHISELHAKLARIKRLAGSKRDKSLGKSNAHLDQGAFARGMGLTGQPGNNVDSQASADARKATYQNTEAIIDLEIPPFLRRAIPTVAS
jgi:hypothetical protein